nr:DUF3298 and DUF4163 domain-containing protein [Pseudobutyrivibrio sp.]
MKKKLALLLVATMSTMAFIGCTKPQQKEEAVEPSTEETEAEDVSDEVEATAPEYATTSVKYDTDSKFYTGSVECLQITDANHANLQKAVDKEFSKIVESFNKTSADYVDEAKKYNEDMASGEDETDGVEPITYNYYYSTTAKVTRCDSKIFSVMLSTEVYTGGAHGSHYDEGIIFDSQTGKILSVADLGITADSVHQYVDTLLEESPEEATGGLFEDYQDTVDSSLSGDMSDVSLWLDDRGLVVEFSEYSLAAYAAGNIKFTVPYSKLTGFDSAYLPENDFYAISLSDLGLIEKIDANDDGTLENIYVTNTVDEDAMEVVYTLHLGDQELAYNADSSMYYVS